MNSLKLLTAFLLSKQYIEKDLLDSWAEYGELVWSGSKLEVIDDYILLFRKKYDAVWSFESFTGNSDQLFTDVMTWLMDNGGDRDELGWPQFDVEINDDDSADVELRIGFEDEVFGVETDEGYQAIDAQISTAETVDFIATGCSG